MLAKRNKFRINERFRYEYDFGDGWDHQVRLQMIIETDDGEPETVEEIGRQKASGRQNFLYVHIIGDAWGRQV